MKSGANNPIWRPGRRSWWRKFADAGLGVRAGVAGQSSCAVHAFATMAVVASAVALQVDRTSWCLLVLCIAMVWTAELFNSALETMARAIDVRRNPHLETGLNIASGAVLIAAAGAVLVGASVFVPAIVRWL